jgi:hypothetical protein
MVLRIPITTLPFEYQAQALASDRKITACVTGARGGKTTVGAMNILHDATAQPGYMPIDYMNGKPYVMAAGAPTFPLIDKVVLPAVMSMIPFQLYVDKYHVTKHLLKIRGKLGETWIYFISAKDVASWYGLDLYRVWLDEFALVKEEVFNELSTARLVSRSGKMFLTGTPQGPNWAYDRIYKPFTEGDKEIQFLTWKTAHNPYVPREEIIKARRMLPDRYYQRTFNATWDTFEGQVYEEFNRGIHCRPRLKYTFVLPNGRMVGDGKEAVRLKVVIAGVDWGFGPGHPGVILVCGKDKHDHWWVLEESVDEAVFIVSADVYADTWINRARKLMEKWQISLFYCDTESPENIQQFRVAEIPVHGAIKKSVKEGIQTVAKYMHPSDMTSEPGLIILDDCRVTIEQHGYYHLKEGTEMPVKALDDTCDALRYALHTHELTGTFDRELAFHAGL